MKIEPKTRDGTQEQSSAAAKSCGISDIRVRGRKRGGGVGWNVGRDRLKSFSRWSYGHFICPVFARLCPSLMFISISSSISISIPPCSSPLRSRRVHGVNDRVLSLAFRVESRVNLPVD